MLWKGVSRVRENSRPTLPTGLLPKTQQHLQHPQPQAVLRLPTSPRRAGPKQAGWLFDLQMKAPHKGIHPVASCRATGRPLDSTPCPHSLVSKTLLNELPFTGQRWVRTPAPASPVYVVFVSSSACSSSAGPCLPPVPPYREEQR